ncbi:urease subunit beta [Thalassobacillus devorans]|uniref:urease subunit beta n=1 Tax=Thalassobacillus devorans TaxID=279813 RepID=UPI00048C258C|nr:urease subunit beta [Thalassobacillus devorans]
MQPGEFLLKKDEILCNAGKDTKKLSVINTGDRPIQVGSHFHFFETNEGLEFNRDDALGYRLNVPAGSAVRFEPGDKKEVELVEFVGDRQIYGLNNKTDGSLQGRGNE